MQDLLSSVRDILLADGWNLQLSDDEEVIVAKYSADFGEWFFFAKQATELDQLAFYSVYPEPCPPHLRTEMVLLLSMINDGLVVGNFEYGFEHDEVRCKTSMEFKVAVFTPEIGRSLVYKNLRLMEDHYAAIRDLIAGDTTAQAVMETIWR
jgi:hypothetical protein